MTRSLLVATLVAAHLATLPWASHAADTDPNAGRFIAANCANCHGTNGASIGGMPALAGRSSDELMRILREFRDGRRPATIMHQLARGYNDAQLRAASNYFAAQKSIRVQP